MPLIDVHQGLIVTGAPGAGSSSILAAFAALPSMRAVPETDLVDDAGRQALDAKHATVSDLVAHGLLPAGHGMTILTTTRNPFTYWPAEWERTRHRWSTELDDETSWVRRQPGAVSRIRAAMDLDFGPWLRQALEPELSGGGTRRINPGHLDEAHLVLRVEHLDDDLDELGMRGWLPVPHLNRGAGRPPTRSYYDDALRTAVEQLYGDDLTRFGYHW